MSKLKQFKIMSLVFFDRCNDEKIKKIIPKNHKRFHSVDEIFNNTLITTDLGYTTINQCSQIYEEIGIDNTNIECHFEWTDDSKFAYEPTHIYLLNFKDTIETDFNKFKIKLNKKYKNCIIHIIHLQNKTTPHLSSLVYTTLNYLIYAISLDLLKNYNLSLYNVIKQYQDNSYINEHDFTIQYSYMKSKETLNVVKLACQYIISYGTSLGNSKLLNYDNTSLKYKYRDDKMGFTNDSFFNVGINNIIPCLSFASSTIMKERHKYIYK